MRVDCVSPGWIDVSGEAPRPEDHAQHPAGRVGRPGDVAATVSFPLGPDSGFATGAEFVLDGGMTQRTIDRDRSAETGRAARCNQLQRRLPRRAVPR